MALKPEKLLVFMGKLSLLRKGGVEWGREGMELSESRRKEAVESTSFALRYPFLSDESLGRAAHTSLGWPPRQVSPTSGVRASPREPVSNDQRGCSASKLS